MVSRQDENLKAQPWANEPSNGGVAARRARGTDSEMIGSAIR